MAKKGAMRRDPKVSTQPVRGEGEQTMTDKATRRAANRAARRAPTERLSPGVYRSASGDLVTQGGRPIRRQPQALMGAPEMGQQFGQMPGQAQGVGQQLGQVAEAANMGQRFGSYDPSLNEGPMQNLVYRMTPDESARTIEYFRNRGVDFNNMPPLQFGGGPTQNPWSPQMPQPSANMGGQYRLSPGVYGSREQAMQQYNQQLAQMRQPAMQAANEAAGQGSPNSGPGSFPMQQRERELGYAENRFDAARNNNLFRGNPVRRFKF